MLAIVPTTPDFMSGILFLILFSFGTMVSMALMTVVMSYPFTKFAKSNTMANSVISIAGILSILLGLALGSDIAFGTDFTGILWY